MRTNWKLLNKGFCCKCLKQIEAIPYSYANSVACEQCVRKYWKGEVAPEEYIAQELHWRADAAARAVALLKVPCELCGRKYAQSRMERHQQKCEGWAAL